MKKKQCLSRRRFLTLGATGAAGCWIGMSEQFPARMGRKLLAELGRTTETPKFVPKPNSWSDREITCAWLGHATALIDFQGFRILTDPVLGHRIGADLPLGKLGPKRLVASPLSPSELPPIDLVLLSHAHMDHLDFQTLGALKTGREENLTAITAARTGDLLRRAGYGRARELKWDESARVETASGSAEVRAFEVKHWGARWRTDDYRGYNGYVISRNGRHLVFGGDTANCGLFRDLRRVGTVEAILMPIGSYKNGPSMHCTPEEAGRMADDCGADRVLAIHHKTFPLGDHGPDEPIERFSQVINSDRLGFKDVGETVFLG